jgi:uncharacterized protein
MTVMTVPIAQLLGPLPGLRQAQLDAVLALLADGATLPFIARYRKERTGGLDEVALRTIAEAHDAYLALTKRRDAILEALTADKLLTPALEASLRTAATRTELEDLYLPFRKKRKTRASTARERGLEPLARLILAQPLDSSPAREAKKFENQDIPDVASALEGARDIVAELVTERADLRALVRHALQHHGRISTRANKKQTDGVRTPYEAYYEHSERVDRLPSHRCLAILRGEDEGFLKMRFELDDARVVEDLLRRIGMNPRSPWRSELEQAVVDGYDRLLRPQIETELRASLKDRADLEAVEVFSKNLESLLLASPLGPKPVIGLDPGFRTGVKCAVLSGTGAVVTCDTLFAHASSAAEKSRAAASLKTLIETHRPFAIAIGNGTASRETEAFARDIVRAISPSPLVVSVNESGASIYSASDLAREELPGLDITYRGAVSIGRRLQDPLAELVKVDPKSLGVGQYQHDVDQKLLGARLDGVVEMVVNRVGVDLNTASPALLQHVAGLGPKLAKTLVDHRDRHGPFRARRELLKVAGLGPARFEQAAGFLRIRGGADPLDASGVHPERYGLVERIARDLGETTASLIGKSFTLDFGKYTDSEIGEPTLRDILAELARPGRDPREAFEAVAFRDDIQSIDDLYPDLELEGVVTNVTAFGAFVDIGVHQDGLVHISRLSDRFVRDPHAVVRPGDRLRVRVLEVDKARKRIGLARVMAAPST